MKVDDRVLVDGKHGATVRYIGPVEGHPGLWLGVEWWNQQGKHDGTFNGKTYFQTTRPLSASFIREQRATCGNSFSEAIYKQYVKSFSDEHVTDQIDYSLFGKQFSDYVVGLSSIVRVDLSNQWVNGFDDNESIYANLSQILELNVRQNLVRNWSQLWFVLEKFAQLETLDVSNCRMDFDQVPPREFRRVKQLILIDTGNDCPTFERILEHFPNLTAVHLDLNHLSCISDALVDRVQHLTNLSLSDNPTLKHWDPFINRLGRLAHLEELIINNCAIAEIVIRKRDDSTELFPSLKQLYLSDNEVSSYSSISELSLMPNLVSLSILRNPIYPANPIECETAKQMIIARLPNLTHINRVLISRDERRGAEIDYLQKHAQDYFDDKLDFAHEHRQYRALVAKYGEPLRPNTNQASRKGLCIRPDLLKIVFQLGDENERTVERKIPSSMTVAKLKGYVRRLYPSQLTADVPFDLFALADKEHKELMSNDYQDVQFYLGNCSQSENIDRPSFIRIEIQR